MRNRKALGSEFASALGALSEELCVIIEATRDLMTFATMAFHNGTSDEKVEAKKTWKEVALQFFADAAKKSRSPKLYRTKVFEWLCSTNFMMMVSTGFTWDKYIIPSDTSIPPLHWPSCTITVDQGSDGCSFTMRATDSGMTHS